MLVNGKKIASNTEFEIKVNDTLQFRNSEFLVTFSDANIGMEPGIDSPEKPPTPANNQMSIGTITENIYRITAMLGKRVFGTFF